jgi:hypothetical protein
MARGARGAPGRWGRRVGEPDRIAAAAGEDLIGHAPVLAAVIHWLTGVVFAVILGALLIFVAPAIPGLGPGLGEIQEKGVDSSMKVRVITRGPADQTLPAGVTGYVFVDIDPAACTAARLGPRCLDRAPTEPGLTARIARAVLGAKPRVVILDATLWDIDPGRSTPAVDFAALAKAARDDPASPIVAAAPFRPTGAADAGVLEWDLVPAPLRGGVIRFAPAMLWRAANEPDDVVRSYSPLAQVQAGATSRPVPTLPLLAALYAEAGGDAARIRGVDCRYGALIGAPVGRCATLGAAPAADRVLQRAETLYPDARLVFTLPPLVSPAGKSAARAAAQFQNVYDRYPASQAFSPAGALLIDPGQLAGKIVVISTSAPTALDFHSTPLGPMSGAELVLNAVAAMLDRHGWVAAPSVGQRAVHEAEIIGLASLPFLLFWLGYCWLAHGLRGRRGAGLVVGLYGGVGFIIAIGAATLLAAAITLESVEHGLANGFAAEFFSPILALSLEGFAEGARWLVDRIESGVDRLVRRVPLPKRV